MDCRVFVDHLYQYLVGKLRPEKWESAGRHVTRCKECRRLFELARAELQISLVDTPDDLANSILKRTSGSPCGRAREYLPEFVDGNLTAEDAELLAHHLIYCPGCRVLAENLREFAEAFPGMALLEPNEDFTRIVLRATTGRHATSPSLVTRIQVWGGRQVRRPRFALEAAYIGTLLWVLAFGSPVSFVRSASFPDKPLNSRSGATQLIPAIWDKSCLEAARISGSISSTLSEQAGSIKSSLHHMKEASVMRGFRTVSGYCGRALRLLKESWQALFR